MNYTEEIYFKNSCWYKNSGALLPLALPHQPIALSAQEIKHLFTLAPSYLIRWHEGFDIGSETNWWFILNDKPRVLSDYKENDRYKIKRGMKIFEPRMLTISEAITEILYPVYENAFLRYKTFEKKVVRENFTQKLLKLKENHEFFGVFSGDKLSGFSINYCQENACFLRYIYFDPQFLQGYSSYVFFYGVCQHYLNERKFRYVTDGVRSISHQTNVHEFLESKFGFRKAYCHLKIKYRMDVKVGIRMLYPFRKILKKIESPLIEPLKVALYQEEVYRGGRIGKV
ncbi:MAG: hypothetical protein A3H98_00685 [Bacteroidetes bacterium RIFCSPLOWO2_02_FULL_36_8]|nr:MAG: hypothetical protein A3H98_00685 [Bacteroidetes bacterium RIFCSPLOWO2_02_FULL_36_8]OFY68733.1 MAG: hypothetical protein A3G23_02765 [Bacteroidetes bacterium RIFCSPLOWO2_12_FULL_37_12]